jgi:pyruvate ferredoxin oxidoreductase delta subunit
MKQNCEPKKKNASQIPIGGTIIKAGNSKLYKTGDWKSFIPIRDAKKCTNCLLCFMFCPEDCIHVKKGKITDADLDYCKGCGICAQICPVKCIEMVSGCDVK